LTETITARLPDELVRKVDSAVKKGIYQNRSEAMRTILESYFIDHPELFLDMSIHELLGNNPLPSDKELERIGSKIFHGKNIARLIAEDRDR
jgi:hypothetical protein